MLERWRAHSHVVIYTVLGASMGVSASSCLSFCFNAFSSVSIWLSSLPAVITVLYDIDNASFVKISSGFKPNALAVARAINQFAQDRKQEFGARALEITLFAIIRWRLSDKQDLNISVFWFPTLFYLKFDIGLFRSVKPVIILKIFATLTDFYLMREVHSE